MYYIYPFLIYMYLPPLSPIRNLLLCLWHWSATNFVSPVGHPLFCCQLHFCSPASPQNSVTVHIAFFDASYYQKLPDTTTHPLLLTANPQSPVPHTHYTSFTYPRSLTQQSLNGLTLPTTALQLIQIWSVFLAVSITNGIQHAGQNTNSIPPQSSHVSIEGNVHVRVFALIWWQWAHWGMTVGCRDRWRLFMSTTGVLLLCAGVLTSLPLVSIPTHALPELLLLLVVLVAAAAFSLAVARACAGVGKEEEDVVA